MFNYIMLRGRIVIFGKHSGRSSVFSETNDLQYKIAKCVQLTVKEYYCTVGN